MFCCAWSDIFLLIHLFDAIKLLGYFMSVREILAKLLFVHIPFSSPLQYYDNEKYIATYTGKYEEFDQLCTK